MAYSKITYQNLVDKFGLKTVKAELFGKVKELKPSNWLLETLNFGTQNQLTSEKAKNEAIVWPIVLEIQKRNSQKFQIFSGTNLDTGLEITEKQKLNGECDFILSSSDSKLLTGNSVFTVVEAKNGELDLGFDQCMAQMIGCKFFNEQHKKTVPFIYGAVTNAYEWQFMKLDCATFLISFEPQLVFFAHLPKLLGIIQSIIDELSPQENLDKLK